MCGITGLWDRAAQPAPAEARDRLAEAMARAIAHRGPDSWATWSEPEVGLSFGHRRLAIVDLSPAGHQPMHSHSGRSVLCYNGEVYTTAELKADLPGRNWRGHSDTEAMLEACEQWGPLAASRRFIGMFAYGWWDRAARELTLVRDRLGIKPLYYGFHGESFVFGSELKCFFALPGWQGQIDRTSLLSYLRFGYVPGPATIFANVRQLEPGSVLTLGAAGAPRIERFWALEDVIREVRAAPPPPTDEAALTDQLEALLKDAVGRRMLADVPLGAFLSGGIDSSTVVALMQTQSARPVKTFSIGFQDKGYNEAQHAKAVAQHLGTDHTELYVTPEMMLGVVPQLPEMYDEPFADSSQIPTHLVSKMARAHVTVALSGDGGDELFCGYTRYLDGLSAWQRLRGVPLPLRRALAAGVKAVPSGVWDALGRVTGPLGLPSLNGSRAERFAGVITTPDARAFYRRLVSYWPNPEAVAAAGTEAWPPRWAPLDPALVRDATDPMRYTDTLTYLPDDILTKADRASMAVSLELRVPLLDHRLVAFAWGLPGDQLRRGATGKHLLRQVLYRHVPRALIDRPKMGFGVPMAAWLRGPLKDWAAALLAPDRLRADGLLNPTEVTTAWDLHARGAERRDYALWVVLMLQAWIERWRPHISLAA